MTGLLVIRLQGIVADLQHRLEKQMADNGRSIVTRDLELEALRQQEEKMRLEIVKLKENIDKLVLYGWSSESNSVKLMAQLTTMT